MLSKPESHNDMSSWRYDSANEVIYYQPNLQSNSSYRILALVSENRISFEERNTRAAEVSRLWSVEIPKGESPPIIERTHIRPKVQIQLNNPDLHAFFHWQDSLPGEEFFEALFIEFLFALLFDADWQKIEGRDSMVKHLNANLFSSGILRKIEYIYARRMHQDAPATSIGDEEKQFLQAYQNWATYILSLDEYSPVPYVRYKSEYGIWFAPAEQELLWMQGLSSPNPHRNKPLDYLSPFGVIPLIILLLLSGISAIYPFECLMEYFGILVAGLLYLFLLLRAAIGPLPYRKDALIPVLARGKWPLLTEQISWLLHRYSFWNAGRMLFWYALNRKAAISIWAAGFLASIMLFVFLDKISGGWYFLALIMLTGIPTLVYTFFLKAGDAWLHFTLPQLQISLLLVWLLRVRGPGSWIPTLEYAPSPWPGWFILPLLLIFTYRTLHQIDPGLKWWSRLWRSSQILAIGLIWASLQGAIIFHYTSTPSAKLDKQVGTLIWENNSACICTSSPPGLPNKEEEVTVYDMKAMCIQHQIDIPVMTSFSGIRFFPYLMLYHLPWVMIIGLFLNMIAKGKGLSSSIE